MSPRLNTFGFGWKKAIAYPYTTGMASRLAPAFALSAGRGWFLHAFLPCVAGVAGGAGGGVLLMKPAERSRMFDWAADQWEDAVNSRNRASEEQVGAAGSCLRIAAAAHQDLPPQPQQPKSQQQLLPTVLLPTVLWVAT